MRIVASRSVFLLVWIVVLMLMLMLSGALAIANAAEEDKKLTFQCTGCHEIGGYRNAFPTSYSTPAIRGQSAAYIESALKAYRSGEREHALMRAIAGQLTDEDIAIIAAYYSTLKSE